MIHNSSNAGSATTEFESCFQTPFVRIIQWTDSWGGMEHHSAQLATHLARRGVPTEITAIGVRAYSMMPERYAQGFAIEEIPWAADRQPSFLEWYRIMRSRPAPISVFPKNWWTKGGLGMMAAAWLAYDRIIVCEHVAVPELPRPSKEKYFGLVPKPNLWYWRHRTYAKLMSVVPDCIVCVSDAVRSRLLVGCGYPSDRTVTVHNGIDCSLFRFDPEARALHRSQLGIPSNAFVVGAVGRLDNGAKRHDVALRLFARLCLEYPDAPLRFLLVGDGQDRAAILRLAEELGVRDRFVLAPFTSTPWESYSILDVFLMPSAFEAFGLGLAEAMACERCVLGMAVEGIREILNEPGIGFAVPQDDTEAFYQAMREALLLGPEGLQIMGGRARESIVRRFDGDQQYERMIAHVLGVG